MDAKPADTEPVADLTAAISRYFDLMYDCDVTRFDRVFFTSAQLHGFREGRITCWPAAQYRDVLSSRRSPKSTGATREQHILLVDFASPQQAVAKVRVRIDEMVFVDHLTYQRIDGEWLITSKAYHRES